MLSCVVVCVDEQLAVAALLLLDQQPAVTVRGGYVRGTVAFLKSYFLVFFLAEKRL